MPRPSKEITEIAGEIRAERDLSYLFYDGAREVWLPKSLVEWDEETKTMQMPEWLAMQKELI